MGCALVCALLVWCATGCTSRYSYFIVGGPAAREELQTLSSLLPAYQGREFYAERFVVIKRIARILSSLGEHGKLALFLTMYVHEHPEDIYGGYYLSLVAQTYSFLGAQPLAAHYYLRALNGFPDLIEEGAHLHRKCLEALVALEARPEERISHYKELIARFSDQIDVARAYYSLGQAYEEVRDWEQAIFNYQQFLRYPDAAIAGLPNAAIRVREKVELLKVRPTWVVRDLPQLVSWIREAIQTKNPFLLNRYRAQVNFFTLSWEQKQLLVPELPPTANFVDYLDSFIYSSNVLVAPELDMDSNSREALLLTERWTYRLPTWYFYFRKVEYPPDPDINGGWEWAGIYFGEKL